MVPDWVSPFSILGRELFLFILTELGGLTDLELHGCLKLFFGDSRGNFKTLVDMGVETVFDLFSFAVELLSFWVVNQSWVEVHQLDVQKHHAGVGAISVVVRA